MKGVALLTGKHTALRPPVEADLPFLVTLRNNLRLQMLLMAQPRANSLPRVREWVARIGGDERSLFFIVAARPRARPLGYIQLTHLDPVHGTAELGICLAEAAQGRGHGREALSLLENYARDVFNLRKIVLRVFAEHAPAAAFYRKAGYKKVGVHQQHFYQSGAYHDVLVMEKFLRVPGHRGRRTG